jgi:hypothetical protein
MQWVAPKADFKIAARNVQSWQKNMPRVDFIVWGQHPCRASGSVQQDAGPNDEERGQPYVPSRASLVRSSSSVSFALDHRTRTTQCQRGHVPNAAERAARVSLAARQLHAAAYAPSFGASSMSSCHRHCSAFSVAHRLTSNFRTAMRFGHPTFSNLSVVACLEQT